MLRMTEERYRSSRTQSSPCITGRSPWSCLTITRWMLGPIAEVVTSLVSLSQNSPLNTSVFGRLGFWSSASPETTKPEAAKSKKNGATHPDKKEASSPEYIEVTNQKVESDSSSDPQPAKRRRKVIVLSDSDSDSESDLSVEDVLYFELRTRHEAETKKFAVQGFAKSLLDVADNLARAASVVENSFSKIDPSKDTAGAVPLLKTLLEGVGMTEKQLLEVFKKSGVEKYDATNEQFDPNRHNAVFQVPDAFKPPGTVAVVLKEISFLPLCIQ